MIRFQTKAERRRELRYYLAKTALAKAYWYGRLDELKRGHK